MPADFGLLGGPQVPMAAGASAAGFDPVGATKAAYDIAGKSLENQEAERAQSEANTDRQFLQEAMKSGKYDIAHPDGIASLTKDYGPKLSPNMNFKLAQMSTKAKEQDAVFRQHLSQLDVNQLKILREQEEGTMPFFGQLLGLHSQIKESKGEQDAQVAFDQGKQHILAQLSSAKLPDGRPRFSPDIIQRVTEMNPEQLTQFYKASDYRKGLLDNAFKEAQIGKTEEATKALKNPQDWQQYTDGAGNSYKWNKKAGVTQVLNKETGEWTPIQALPPDAKPITGVNPKGAQSPLGRMIADKETLTRDGKWTAEHEKMFSAAVGKITGGGGSDVITEMSPEQREWLVVFGANGGKIPNLPLGVGASAAAARKQLIKDYVTVAMAQKLDPADGAQEQLLVKAITSTMSTLQKQNGIIVSSEKTVDKALTNIEGELKRIGGPDSPVARKYWNEAMTKVIGSAEFPALNAYYTEVVEGMAKVFSNATGAGSPPVGYLELAKKVIDPNMNFGQFIKSAEAMRNLMTNRQKAVEETIAGLRAGSKSTMKAGSGALGTSAAPTPAPAGQTALDDQANKYLKVLLPQATNAQLKPEERKQAIATAKAAYDEIKKAGGNVPAPPVAEAAAAPAAAASGPESWDKDKRARYEAYKAAHP